MKNKIGLFPIVYLLLLFFVLPIKSSAQVGPVEYISSVAVETINVWRRHLVEPLSKMWEPWFLPADSQTASVYNVFVEKSETVSATPNYLGVDARIPVIEPAGMSKEEAISYINSLFSVLPAPTTIQNITNTYVRSGGTEGLADSISKVTSNIQSDVSTLSQDVSTLTETVNSLSISGMWSASGSDVYRVSGKVGIGTSTPQDKLEVVGNITSNGVLSSIGTASNSAQLYLFDDVNGYGGIDIEIFSDDSFGTAHPYINLISSQGSQSARSRVLSGNDLGTLNFYGQADSGLELSAAIGAVAVADFTGASAQSDLYFTTNKSEKARITSAGNFGIGTTTPFAKLSVESTAGSVQFVVGSSTATQFIVDRNGNVGIGEKTPGAKLSVSGGLAVGSGYDTTSVTDGNLIVSSNIGVGTNSPTLAKLQVSGGTYYDSILAISSDTLGPGVAISNTGAGGRSYALISTGSSATPGAGSFGVYDTTDNAYRLVVNTSGNIGIGTTTPFAKLSVESTAGSVQFVVGSSTATQFIVDKNGNVGVGTGTPTVKLHVNGSLNVTTGNRIVVNTTPGMEYADGVIQANNGAFGGFIVTGNSTVYGTSFLSPSGTIAFGNSSSGTEGMGFPASQTLAFRTGGTERLRINSSGNVGIGTTSPDFRTEVVAAPGSYSGGLAYSGYNNGGVASSRTILGGFNNGGDVWSYLGLGANYNNGGQFTAQQAAPSILLNRNGNVTLYSDTGKTVGSSYTPTARLVVDTSGNLGIGTTTPWRTLSVNGTAAMPGLVNDSTGYYVCLNTTTGQMSTSTTACGASSERFKENIQDISYGLNEVLKLRPVSFDYKQNYIPNAPKQLGFIAEEVDLLVPELVARDDAGQIQGLDYPKFTALLVRAVQQLNERWDNMALVIQETVDKYLASNDVYIRSVATDGLEVNGTIKVGGDICVDDTCITKEQFKEMILRSGVGAVQQVGSPQVVDDSGEEENTETASSTPEIISETSEENATTTGEVIEEVATTTPEAVE